MAILIAVQNAELAAQIAHTFNGSGQTTKVCPSISSDFFSREFSQAELVVTDVTPPVLAVLPVGGRTLLAAGVPLVVLASAGHIASFTATLPVGSAACVAIEPGTEFGSRLRDAAERLMTSRSVAADLQIGPKQVAFDAGHDHRQSPASRRIVDRQIRLLGDIAHDLRTPLAAIMEFAHLMDVGLAGDMTDQQRRYVGIIERRCGDAARLVDNLLDGAKLQSGRVHPHREAVDLADVLRSVQETLEPALKNSGVRLDVELPDDLPRVFADHDMLGRIMGNLASNAIKFSPDNGRVRIHVHRHSVSTAAVSVIDSGAGISARDLRRIFRRFSQGSNAHHGVGLGLAIVRRLVRLHGGQVTVESAPGKGSCFRFTLPLFLPSAIIRRHLSRVVDSPNVPVSRWAFTGSDTARLSALHRLITATVRSRDLVLRCDERRILLVTQSRTPQQLVQTIVQQFASRGGAAPSVQQLSPAELKRWLDGVAATRIADDQPNTVQRAG
jgi:signal transduction histidine kinase